MKMKKVSLRFTAVFLALLFMFLTATSVTADNSEVSEPTTATEETTVTDGEETTSPDGEGEEETVHHALVLQSESMSVVVRKTIQMTASVSNVDVQPAITWSSSDEKVATVDSTGKVKGVDVGRAIIFATAVVDGETLRGEFPINVVKSEDFVKNLLEGRQILSYQYSYVDDYYYTNDKEAWQYDFGFGKIYDFAAPYLLLEYDYIRVFFTYENKDWMLQMWKGQYGLLFYGGEIGIYNRPHSDEGMNEWTFFNCPAEEDWLMMEMSLYHQNIQGEYVREFTREYDKYWWCTGFKNGHLRVQEPADELRLEGRITFKDEEMTQIVVDGLKECGFGQSESKDELGLDELYVEGTDVYFRWQNINEAESTMAIKVIGGSLTALMLLPYFPLIAPFLLPFLNFFLGAIALIYIIA